MARKNHPYQQFRFCRSLGVPRLPEESSLPELFNPIFSKILRKTPTHLLHSLPHARTGHSDNSVTSPGATLSSSYKYGCWDWNPDFAILLCWCASEFSRRPLLAASPYTTVHLPRFLQLVPTRSPSLCKLAEGTGGGWDNVDRLDFEKWTVLIAVILHILPRRNINKVTSRQDVARKNDLV